MTWETRYNTITRKWEMIGKDKGKPVIYWVKTSHENLAECVVYSETNYQNNKVIATFKEKKNGNKD